ncbi:MAG: HYR domain-containing protein [Ilumatobacter sp.]
MNAHPVRLLLALVLTGSALSIAAPAPGPAAALPGETAPTISSSVLTGPPGSVGFGHQVVVLANGNYAVSDPEWNDEFGMSVGAVHLYDGANDLLISTLHGSADGDGEAVRLTEVGDSNLVANWLSHGSDLGAVTWIDGTSGLSGEVDAENSLVGQPGRELSAEIHVLTSGDYVVLAGVAPTKGTPPIGAATFGSGNTGVTGELSAQRSLLGSTSNDFRLARVEELTNGNFVIVTPGWDDGSAADVGAATLGQAGVGVVGTISSSTSLVGTQQDDGREMGVEPLTNGHYVVSTPWWSNGSVESVGAVTWADGATGLAGRISPSTSLVGSSPLDLIGLETVSLANGNYVAASQVWDRSVTAVDAGAVTWLVGTGPTSAVVSTANSLYGKGDDRIGQLVTPLSNGHVLVRSPNYSVAFSSNVGAVTWMDGTSATSEQVTNNNSVVGSSTDDQVGTWIVPLDDSNAVAVSPYWNAGTIEDAGAVTWVSGSGPTASAVSASNSLVGERANDSVGSATFFTTKQLRVLPIEGGAYLVGSPDRDDPVGGVDAGAATWVSSGMAWTGFVDATNSLVGTSAGDRVGAELEHGVAGSAFVVSDEWSADSGAVTWMDDRNRAVGPVDRFNSFVGGPGARVGARVQRLSTGDLMLSIPDFEVGGDEVGAVAWASGNSGRVGEATAGNVVVGESAGDLAGALFYELDTGDVVSYFELLDSGPEVDIGGLTLHVPGPDMTGTVGATNTVFGSGGLVSLRPELRLTSLDSILISTQDNQVLVMDLDRPPLFESVPDDVSTFAPSGASEVAVAYRLPAAVDSRDGLIRADCLPAPRSAFPIGTTTVSCVATDSAGFTATMSFSVSVERRVALESLVPVRLLDTRSSGETLDGQFAGVGRLDAGDVIELQVSGRASLPPDQGAAVVLNVTMVRPAGNGFVTVYPCGERPLASSMNAPNGGGVVANELVVRADAAGRVCLYSSTPTDLVADLTGFAAAPDGITAVEPARLLDTRRTGRTVDDRASGDGRLAAADEIELDVLGRGGVPDAEVGSVVLNVTMIRPDGNGFVTVYPCGDRPLASSMNAPDGGGVVANEVIAKVSAKGTVCLYSSVGTDLAADVAGFVPNPSGIVSLKPARLLDTRSNGETTDDGFAALGRVDADRFVELDVGGRGGVPSSGVGSVVLNVTMIRPDGNGFVTVYPCGDRPLASSMNAPSGGGVVANEVIAKVSTEGTVCLYSSVGTNLAADVTGYVTAA